MKFTDRAIFLASSGQVSCDLGDGAVILNLKDGSYYGLNPIGARIWELLQQPRTFTEIQETLVMEYDVEAETCRNEVVQLLQDLASRGLIEVEDEVAG